MDSFFQVLNCLLFSGPLAIDIKRVTIGNKSYRFIISRCHTHGRLYLDLDTPHSFTSQYALHCL